MSVVHYESEEFYIANPEKIRPEFWRIHNCGLCQDSEAKFAATDTGERDEKNNATWLVNCRCCGNGYRMTGGGYGDPDSFRDGVDPGEDFDV